MKVLIIKTSSIGDILHTLPALTDAVSVIPEIQFDWVVEESCIEIPAWHASVRRIIPVALRRWRKKILRPFINGEYLQFWRELRREKYDLIIDAQGLTKSALIGRLAKGDCYGLDSQSARDPVAHIHYQKKFSIGWDLHAVTRIRALFAKSLGYGLPTTRPDYAIQKEQLISASLPGKYLVFLHGTTWNTKLYPEEYWRDLVKLASQHGYPVYLNSGNPAELTRAKQIIKDIDGAVAMPRQDFATLAAILHNAKGVVSVDTGLGHLTAALATPAVSLYGPTHAAKTGAFGDHQTHLQSSLPCSPCLDKTCTKPAVDNITPPCYSVLPPALVWEKLSSAMHLAQAQPCA